MPRRRAHALAAVLSVAVANASLPLPTWAAAPVDPDRPIQVDPGGDPALRAAAAAELGLPDHPEVAAALALAGARRHAEAAAALEALANTLGDPRLLYHAALLRSLAREHTAALRLYDAFIARTEGVLTPAIRKYVGDLRDAELALTVEVVVALLEETGSPIPPERRSQASITLRPEGATSSIAIPANDVPVRIDAGRYEIAVESLDYYPSRTLAAASAPGPARWEITLARRRVQQELRFRPRRALRRGHLRLTSTDLQPPRVIDAEIPDEQVSVVLTTGLWTIEASGGRRYQATRSVIVRDPSSPLEVVLEKTRADAGPRLRSDKKFHYGLIGYVGASYLAGVGLLLGGIFRDTRVKERNEAAFLDAGIDLSADDPITPAALDAVDASYPTADYHRDLARISNLQTSGIVVAISGAGSALTIIPVVTGRRRAAYIQLGVGAAFLAGGIAWMSAFVKMSHDLLDPIDPQLRATPSQFSALTGHRLGAGMFTGFGLGSVLGPVIALIRDRVRR